MTLHQCIECGAANPSSHKFCGQCGAAIPLRCNACNATNAAGNRFCGQCGRALVEPDRQPSQTSAEHLDGATASRAAERKTVTAVFADLVGSTALSTVLDPEDLAAVLRQYRECASDAVNRYDGFIAKFLGDGILAYFGYPTAQENDAERALLAAFEMVEGVSTIVAPSGISLTIRVGISTGLVVVGEIISLRDSLERNIVGETPNRAARLQAAAEPSWVLVDSTTRRAVGELFSFEDLGERLFKGFAVPVRVWRAVAVGRSENRYEALRGSVAHPLLGRSAELELLRSLSQRARKGQGQVALICAEPGLGKSRLVASLGSEENWTTLRYFCSPLHSGTAFHPFIAQIESSMGLRPGQPLDERITLIEGTLARFKTLSQEQRSAITDLLTGRSQATGSKLLPVERKRQFENAIEVQISELVGQSPLRIIVEDVHWADANSRDLIGTLIQWAASLPIFLVITFRPELSHGWGAHRHAHLVNLAQLSRDEVASLVGAIARGKSVPHAIIDQIVERTDGVPLFVEELTRAILESGMLEETPDEFVLRPSAKQLGIPETLHGSLLARLDRLGSAKEVAQIGAAIGREFSYDLLKTLEHRTELQLDSDIRRLLQSGLVEFRSSSARIYAFRHALVQEAAYSTLLRARRQELHQEIARVLESNFPEIAAAQPALLAHHYTEANRPAAGATYWEKAADLAASRAAYPDACKLFDTAIEVVGKAPELSSPGQAELRLRLKAGAALSVALGPGAEAVERNFSAAAQLAENAGDSEASYRALWGLYYNHLGRGRMRQAHAEAGRLVETSKQLSNDLLKVEAMHAAWTTAHFSGRPLEAKAFIEEGWRLYDARQHEMQSIAFSGHDPGACSRGIMSMSLWILGFPERAFEMGQEALEYSRTRGHAFSAAWAGWMVATVYQLAGDAERCLALAETAADQSRRFGFGTAGPIAEMLILWSRQKLGKSSAWDTIRSMRAASEKAGPNHRLGPWWHSLMATASMEAGDSETALGILRRGIVLSEETGLCFALPELHRLLGEYGKDGSDRAHGARNHFMTALAVARDRGMKQLELRAACSLVSISKNAGDAREYLLPLCDSFSEGRDTADFVKARELLSALSA